MTQYKSEKIMSRDFESYLKLHLGNTYYKEWQGLFGVPDYVCFDKQGDEIQVVAFELKLTDWRRAMVQAFRYRSFSPLSYVVMPEASLESAIRHVSEFEKYGIGLLSFGPAGLRTICEASPSVPYSPQLSGKVIDKVRRSRKKSLAKVSDLVTAL